MAMEPEPQHGRYNYIVTARSEYDTWSYGPFVNRIDAVHLEQTLAEQYPDIDYDTATLMHPSEALS